MKISVNTVRLSVPQSFITKGKQRLKQNVDTVYLNNGDEFEIELFNPKQNKVLAQIEINGKTIGGGGIVLRPGERVFLERYLDDAKKFLFETYNIDRNNEEAVNAAINNGDVTVKFFDEMVVPYFNSTFIVTNNPLCNKWNTPFYYSGTSGKNPFNNDYLTTNFLNTNQSSSIGLESKEITMSYFNSEVKNVETGRVEKGSESKQSFENDSSSFNVLPITTNKWKIKPTSQQVVTKEDLKVYCDCGFRRKKDSYKFCPHCGKELSNRTETKIIYVDTLSYNYDGQVYYFQTFNETIDKFIEKNKNKFIVINRNSLTENHLRGVVID